jgi:hypothetical protein
MSVCEECAVLSKDLVPICYVVCDLDGLQVRLSTYNN